MTTLNVAREAQYLASQQDRIYFFEHFYHIPIIGKGAELFNPRTYQREVASAFDDNKLVIGLKARQIGWTTIGMGFAMHDALFNVEHPWLLVSKTEDASVKMLEKA